MYIYHEYTLLAHCPMLCLKSDVVCILHLINVLVGPQLNVYLENHLQLLIYPYLGFEDSISVL
jgi:hypothetical protein